jgi:hypothetical protein
VIKNDEIALVITTVVEERRNAIADSGYIPHLCTGSRDDLTTIAGAEAAVEGSGTWIGPM